jgi:hypothetical protein
MLGPSDCFRWILKHDSTVIFVGFGFLVVDFFKFIGQFRSRKNNVVPPPFYTGGIRSHDP